MVIESAPEKIVIRSIRACNLFLARNGNEILSPHLPIKGPALLLIMLTSLIFPLMPGCDGVIEPQQYKGTAHTTITYLDYDANGKEVLIEEKEYQKEVLVIIEPPKNAGSVFESNPFSLTRYIFRTPFVPILAQKVFLLLS